MEIHVPAMRGNMGSRPYYSCLMPLAAFPELFRSTDRVKSNSEDCEQGVYDIDSVDTFVTGINEKGDDYLFSSITASYKAEPKFDPFTSDSNIGILKLHLGNELVINDGQHRAAGIARVLKDGAPALRDYTLAILLFPCENDNHIQKMFSDLNHFVEKTSKALDVLHEKHNKISAATMTMMQSVPVFKKLTEEEKVALGAKSTKLFTLAALYDANIAEANALSLAFSSSEGLVSLPREK